MSKAKAKCTTKSVIELLPEQPDAAVINACIAFAMHTAAGYAAHNADPDGNSTNAVPHSTKLWAKAEASLIEATAVAHTLRGVRAKARLLSRLQDGEGVLATFDEVEVQFARSVGRDVEALLRKWDDLTIVGPTDRPTALALPSLEIARKVVAS